MKIPLDFFLRLIEKFLDEREFSDVIKKLKKHFETPEEDFSDILSDLSLQQIISTYVKNNKDLKKKLKSKAKKFLEENKDNNEEEEKEEQKLTTKKRKRTMSSTKGEKEENEEEKKPKRKRTMSTSKEEKEKEKSNSKRKKTEDNNDDDKEEKEAKKEKKEKSKDKKRKKTEDNDDNNEDDDKEEKKIKSDKKKKKKKNDDDDIDLEKEVKFIPKPKSDSNPDRVPFKRIDDSHTKYQVPKAFRDNSYEAFMKQTGDDFGKAANDKLIVTRGKGFRKEKTKFKNKTFHGGMSISTSVRSIPLEDDSSSD